MPVPVPSPENQEPRRLLRDVVYDKMVSAILDGTLELGERLNDEELVRWLGVSRTPVREAIAKLAEQGLVDIEANRFTRVVAPSYDQFLDIVRVGYDVWSLTLRRGVPNLTGADRDAVAFWLDKRAAGFAEHRLESFTAFDESAGLVLAAAASPMLARLRTVTGPIVTLLFQRTGNLGIYPWDAGITMTRALRDAVLDGDGERAGDLVAAQPDLFEDYYAEVRASGIFPV